MGSVSDAALLRQLQAIHAVQTQFLAAAPANATFDRLLAALLEVTDSAYGFIGEVHRSADGAPFLKTQALTNIAWDEATRAFYTEHAPQGLEFRNLQTLFGHTLRTGEPVIANQPAQHPSAAGIPAGHPALRAFLGLPLFDGTELLGMVGIANRPGGYDQALVDFLQPMLATCTGLIRSYRLARERQAAETRLRQAMHAADAANRAKSAFLANMSHELRTPLTAILGFAAELQQPDLTAAQRSEATATILRNGDHLLALLNDILDLSRVEAGQLPVEIVRCSPWAVAADVCNTLASRAAQKGLSLKLEAEGPLPETIATDPLRLRQILMNLVGNAVKFTDRGGVLVKLCLQGQQLVGRVEDTGIGIPADRLGALFQPFVQADASTTRRFGGSGLGLAIAARLAERLGGAIHAASVPGQGSVFTVAVACGDLTGVPIEPPDELAGVAAHGPAAAPLRRIELRGRVLVVDDAADNRKLLAQVLGRTGVELATAVDGRDAMQQVAAATAGGRDFDLVLLDMQMPEVDGYAAAAQLRARGFARPIVALTASAMAGDRERCLAAGCSGFLTKPIRPQELLETLRVLLPAR